MQRWCAKLRSLSISSSSSLLRPSPSRTIRHLHSSTSSVSRSAFQFSSVIPSAFKTLGNSFAYSSANLNVSPVLSLSRLPGSFAVQVRNFSAKSKEKKWKKLTPTVSKVKKYKIKPYSSYKGRFRLQKDGTIRRWREGKRHNAHLKSKQAKRRLRKPSTVPVAYAKVMKKLNFSSN